MAAEQTIPPKIQLYVIGLFSFFDNLKFVTAKNLKAQIFLYYLLKSHQ